MATTPAGDKITAFCDQFFQDLGNVCRQIKSDENSNMVHIKVGTYQSIAIYLWPTILASLKNRKNITLSMKTGRSSVILESLIKKKVDIAVTVGSSNSPQIVKHELYDDHYSFYISKSFKKNLLTKEELSELNLIYMPESSDEVGNQLRNFVQQYELKFWR